jgi:UDP-glucose 4-epimerase
MLLAGALSAPLWCPIGENLSVLLLQLPPRPVCTRASGRWEAVKAVISGSHGFIGSHLSEVLTSRGFQVIPIRRELLFSSADLGEFFRREMPDYVFHLAAYGNMVRQKDRAMTFAANLAATFNLLNESLAVPYRAFINFGTSSEYGRKTKAMSEQDMLAPETLYAAAKAGATHLAGAFARQYDKPIFTLRPFSVYGPGEADFRFIPTIISSMLTSRPFPLDEQGNHDWIYIDDLLDAVLLVLDQASSLTETHRVLDVGSGCMYSNLQVCETLKKVSGLEYIATRVSGLRRNDSSVWVSDNRLIAALGFQPRHSLSDGLRRTFHYYERIHEAEF